MLVVAQFYEYKMGHIPDKATESVFGYASVLPGAWCIFRWDAIKGEPLTTFYKGADKEEHSLFDANKFLAEDRVLCWQILNRKDEPVPLMIEEDEELLKKEKENDKDVWKS